MATAFDHEESMTHEEILLRFKKVMDRDMTPKRSIDSSCQTRLKLWPHD